MTPTSNVAKPEQYAFRMSYSGHVTNRIIENFVIRHARRNEESESYELLRYLYFISFILRLSSGNRYAFRLKTIFVSLIFQYIEPMSYMYRVQCTYS